MFIGFMDIMYQVGAIIGFWVGYGCAKHIANDSATQWRIPVAMQIPMVVILLVGLPFVPETPRFLISEYSSLLSPQHPNYSSLKSHYV